MSLAEKLVIIAENEPRVYDAGYVEGHALGHEEGYDKGLEEGDSKGYTRGYAEGKTAGYGEGYDTGYEIGYEIGNTNGETVGYTKAETEFWNGVQEGGSRTDYQYAFRRWGAEYIRPIYKIVPESNCSYMFAYNPNLKVIEMEYFDLSNATYNPTSTSSTTYALCTNCSELVDFQDIGLQDGHYNLTWSNCRKLKTIHKLRSTKDCKWTNAFQNDYDLEDILEIEGEIGQDGFNVSASTKLTRATLLRILNALYDYSGEGGKHTITLGLENQEKVAEEIESIANARGWTVA